MPAEGAADLNKGCIMAFIVGSLFFIVVLGLLDARLPWPGRVGRETRR